MSGYALLFDTSSHLAYCCICERPRACQCSDSAVDHEADPCLTCWEAHLRELEQEREEQMSVALKTGLVYPVF